MPVAHARVGAERLDAEVNVRLRNQLVPGVEGGFTLNQLTGETSSTYEAGLGALNEGRVADAVRVRADDIVFRMHVRLDTDYYRHGGITKYVMRRLLGGHTAQATA